MVLADHANVGSFHEVTGGAEPFFEFADRGRRHRGGWQCTAPLLFDGRNEADGWLAERAAPWLCHRPPSDPALSVLRPMGMKLH